MPYRFFIVVGTGRLWPLRLRPTHDPDDPSGVSPIRPGSLTYIRDWSLPRSEIPVRCLFVDLSILLPRKSVQLGTVSSSPTEPPYSEVRVPYMFGVDLSVYVPSVSPGVVVSHHGVGGELWSDEDNDSTPALLTSSDFLRSLVLSRLRPEEVGGYRWVGCCPRGGTWRGESRWSRTPEDDTC